MNLRTLYVSKLAKCPLTCLADLAEGQDAACLFLFYSEAVQADSYYIGGSSQSAYFLASHSMVSHVFEFVLVSV